MNLVNYIGYCGFIKPTKKTFKGQIELGFNTSEINFIFLQNWVLINCSFKSNYNLLFFKINFIFMLQPQQFKVQHLE